MPIIQKPKTEVKPSLIIRKIGKLTKPMVHHLGVLICP